MGQYIQMVNNISKLTHLIHSTDRLTSRSFSMFHFLAMSASFLKRRTAKVHSSIVMVTPILVLGWWVTPAHSESFERWPLVAREKFFKILPSLIYDSFVMTCVFSPEWSSLWPRSLHLDFRWRVLGLMGCQLTADSSTVKQDWGGILYHSHWSYLIYLDHIVIVIVFVSAQQHARSRSLQMESFEWAVLRRMAKWANVRNWNKTLCIRRFNDRSKEIIHLQAWIGN